MTHAGHGHDGVEHSNIVTRKTTTKKTEYKHNVIFKLSYHKTTDKPKISVCMIRDISHTAAESEQ